MTTDDNEGVSKQETQESTEEKIQLESNGKVVPTKSAEELINDAMDKFNTKIDELLKAHKSETEQLKEQITKKDEEIEKLKTVNRSIIMSTDLSKNKDSEIDFSSVDFDDVNWGKEASAYLQTIDSKVF